MFSQVVVFRPGTNSSFWYLILHVWLSREQAREVFNMCNVIIILKLVITPTPSSEGIESSMRGTDPWGETAKQSHSAGFSPA